MMTSFLWAFPQVSRSPVLYKIMMNSLNFEKLYALTQYEIPHNEPQRKRLHAILTLASKLNFLINEG